MRRSMGDRWGTDTDMESHSTKLMKHVNTCNNHAIFNICLLFIVFEIMHLFTDSSPAVNFSLSRVSAPFGFHEGS